MAQRRKYLFDAGGAGCRIARQELLPMDAARRVRRDQEFNAIGEDVAVRIQPRIRGMSFNPASSCEFGLKLVAIAR